MAIAIRNVITNPQILSDKVYNRSKNAENNASRFNKETRENRGEKQSIPESKSPEEKDFFWTYTEEPHRTRRQAIIQAHPEVTKLCGPEPLTKYIVTGVVVLQILCAWLLGDATVISWKFIVTAYVVGATANQNLFLAIHEISHNLAFRSPMANRLLAIFANLPIGIPYSASFRPYHLTHHKSLGVDGLDTDLPTAIEAALLDSVLGKAFFATFQIFFYALRPMVVYQIPITRIHVLNITTQLIFDFALVRFAGVKALVFLILSSFFAGSLHPCAAHFIAEHYVLNGPDAPAPKTPPVSSNASLYPKVIASGTDASQSPFPNAPLPETFSYYGPLNLLTYNVGLHNEHHDFPAVPWTRLPRLHAIAKDFYRDTPRHESWVSIFWLFIWDARVGLWCRVKRVQGGRKVNSGNTINAAASGGWPEQDLGANEATEGHIPGVR